MAFARNDTVRLLIRMGLSMDDWDRVSAKMNQLEQTSELVIGNIQQWLDQLDTLDKQLSETLATPNFAITKADVLQYGEKQKPYGILMEMLRIVQQIGNLIEIEPNLSGINDQLALVGAPQVNSIVGRIVRS